jgi:cytidylate kinase
VKPKARPSTRWNSGISSAVMGLNVITVVLLVRAEHMMRAKRRRTSMATVTLTGHLGSMGTIDERVAEALGYSLLDRELLVEAAESLGWSEQDVQAFDERTRGQGGRLARLLRSFVEHSPAAMADAEGLSLITATYGEMAGPAMAPRDERYIAALRALIEQAAGRGDAVIVGRGGQAILAGRPEVIHVRVVCDPEERIRRIAARDSMEPDAARARVVDSDEQREAWHQKYFGIDYRSPYLYHLVVNSGWLGDELAGELIADLVRSLAPAAAKT